MTVHAVRYRNIGEDGDAVCPLMNWPFDSTCGVQEGITGGRFTGWLTSGDGGTLIPHIRGTAYVTGRSTLLFDEADPFRLGLPVE